MGKCVTRPRQETLTHDDHFPIFICRDNHFDGEKKWNGFEGNGEN